MKKAVVCPVFDEGEVWRGIADALVEFFDFVVIVDDGSSEPIDPSAHPDLTVLRHGANRGKGRALTTGFSHCLSQGCDLIATIDGDGEHAPEAFLPVLRDYAGDDLINLSRARFFGEYDAPRRKRNIAISRMISAQIGVELRDSQSGMRLFSARAVAELLRRGLPAGYAVETQMLYTLAAADMTISEVPMVSLGGVRPGKKTSNAATLLSDIRFFAATALSGTALLAMETRSETTAMGRAVGRN